MKVGIGKEELLANLKLFPSLRVERLTDTVCNEARVRYIVIHPNFGTDQNVEHECQLFY
jgi:hypothetical protein